MLLKNIEPEKLVNIPKKISKYTIFTLVKTGNRKDIFGEEIKKWGKYWISFIDNKMSSNDNIEKKIWNIKLILLKLLKLWVIKLIL